MRPPSTVSCRPRARPCLTFAPLLPGGGESRSGDRVLKHVVKVLGERGETVGDETIKHEVSVFDPLEVFGEGGALASSGAQLQTPHFYLRDSAPPEMNAMAEVIKAADAYVVVTCEYNHSIPPALTSMMGHFGGSNYAFKPSAVVTYSPGQAGGARVAMALRPFLSELGCLPVSKTVNFSEPAKLLTEEGEVADPEARMLKQLPAMLGQFEWMAQALAKQRAVAGVPS